MNLEEIRDWFCGTETRASFDDIVRIKKLIVEVERLRVLIRMGWKERAEKAEAAAWYLKEKLDERR